MDFPDGSERDRGSRSFVGLAALLLRRRRLLIGMPLAVAFAAVAFSLIMGKEFTAESRLLPEQETELPADIAGIAAQFGVAMGAGGQTESVDFYAELLGSNELLRQVAVTRYEVPLPDRPDTLRGDLIDLYDVDGDDRTAQLMALIGQLRERDIVAEPHHASNLVVLRTSAPWPALAEAINRRMLELVNAFNLQRRQARAAHEEEFLQERVAAAERDLRAAESELQRFMLANRRYSESPETAFEYGRLQRRVDFLQQIHLGLAQGLEQARVESIRNTPVITVVDPPEGTSLQTAPMLLLNLVLGLLLGGALALTLVIGGEMLRRARETNPAEYRELSAATRAAVADPLAMRRGQATGGVGAVAEATPDDRPLAASGHHEGR